MRLSQPVGLAILAVIGGFIALPGAAAAQTADAGAKIAFSVPQQSMSTALTAIGEQSGLTIIIETKLSRGLRARSLSGSYTPDEALRKILEPAGLKAEYLDAKTILIRSADERASGRTDAAGTMTLAQNTLQGAGNSGPATQKSAEEEESDERTMVVTGTNIRGGAGPVGQQIDVITRDDIILSGVDSLNELRDLIPQNFNGSGSDPSMFITGQGMATSRDSSDSSNSTRFNLRGLGAGSTLTLLNGRRLAAPGNTEAFGIGAIPISLVERVEVVPDGGSAVYGSDAVGGVVNIVTRTDFSGLELSARYAAAAHSDNTERGVNAVMGNSWSSGNAFLYADFKKTDPLLAGDRDYISSLVDPQDTLVPDEERTGFYASVNQRVSSRLSLGADALWSESAMSFYADPINTDDGLPGTFDTTTRAFYASAHAQYELPRDWVMTGTLDSSRGVSRATNDPPNVLGSSLSVTKNRSSAAELALSGAAFHLPAGPVNMALGGVVRRQQSESNIGFAKTSRNVYSAYSEFLVPVRSNLLLSLAARWDDYDAVSSVTPKYGLSWQPSKSLKLRASYAEAFRAPGLRQRINGQTLSFRQIRWNGRPPGEQVPGVGRGLAYTAVLSGDEPLRHETADIFTAGFDLRPEFLPGLRVGVTYFDIVYDDIMFNVIPGLRINDAAFAELVTPDPDPALLQALLDSSDTVANTLPIPINLPAVQVLMRAGLRNIAKMETSGLDINTKYRMGLGAGNLTLGLKGTYVFNYILQGTALVPPVDNVDRVGDPLRLTIVGTAAYSQGPWTFVTGLSFKDAYVDDLFAFDPVPAPVPIDSQISMNLGVHYDTSHGAAGGWLDHMRASLTINNITDEKPPYVQDWFGFNYDAANADVIGRYISFQLTKSWR